MANRLTLGSQLGWGALVLGTALGFAACGDGPATTAPCTGPSCGSMGGAAGGVTPVERSGATNGGALDSGPTASGDAGMAQGGEPTQIVGAGGAGAGGGEAGPRVLSVSPADASDGADPATEIVITFSEPLDPNTVDAQSIRLTDAGAIVPATISYESGQVMLKPQAPLGLLASYTVSVTTAVADEQALPLQSAFASSFAVRDGAWKTIGAVTGSIYQISSTLPMTATGDVLVSWIAINKPGFYCPTSARWFSLGQPITPIKLMTGNDIQDCRSVTAASNATGTAAVVWQEDAEFAQQYRAGAWLPGKPKVSSSGTNSYFSVAVEPDGKVTFFQHLIGSTAWRSDANGNFNQAGDAISSELVHSDAPIVFDADGNGLAAWSAGDATNHQKILVSRYTPTAGQWQTASTIPGSLAASTGSNYERGAPALALDADGGAMMLWVKEEGAASSALMASRFHKASGWADPVPISSNLLVKPVYDHPGLVFDGQTFVAAWTAQDGAFVHTYTARYDIKSELWAAPQQRTPNAELPSLARMPVLGVDGHGNLLLVWARGKEFAYQRYVATKATWSASISLPGGTIDDSNFEGAPRMPLGVAQNGRAALMWSARDTGDFHDINLASFF